YSVVPHPIAQIYSSPKKDLSWTGLPEFADDTITDYSRPSPAIKSTSDDAQNKNPSVTKTGASDSTILSKPFITFVKEADCTEVKINKVEAIKKSSVKYAKMYKRATKKPNVRGNQRNWNNLKSHQLGPDFVMKKKACFNCGDFNHLAYDCRKRVKKGTSRSQNKTHESFKPRPVVHRTFRPPVRRMRSNMNSAQPNRTTFNKQAHSYANRPFQRISAVRSQYRASWVPTVNRNFLSVNRKFSTGSRKFPTGSTNVFTVCCCCLRHVNTARTKAMINRRNWVNDVKASACWVWKPVKSNSASIILKRYDYVDTEDPDFSFNIIEHYGKLWEYRQAILDLNPGSTCHIDVDVQDNGQNRFHSLYICFKGVKDGWLSGCKKVIGINGCFITHVCKGELLTAMGRDANNQMYLIVWEIVDVETTNNWCWFLCLLADDLQLEEGLGLTIISDSHKGTATSTIEQDFTSKMREIRALDEGAYAFLMERDLATWCTAYFQRTISYASFENGISESFNAQILSARGESCKRGGGSFSRGRGTASMDRGTASKRGRGSATVGRGFARGSTTVRRGSATVGRGSARGSATVGMGSVSKIGGSARSTAMGRGSRNKRGETPRKGFDDSNNTKENQIIKDKDAMHEVMQEVMDGEERLHAEKEQRLDSEREHNGRIFQDWYDTKWDHVSQDQLFKGPTLSVLKAVDEAIQEHNDGLPSISEGQFHSLNQASGNSEHPISQPAPILLETTTEESHTPKAQTPRPQIMPKGKSERIAKKRKFNYPADGTGKTPDKPFSL
nr:hypothetical protein [Tanacetum cinerariifolium]